MLLMSQGGCENKQGEANKCLRSDRMGLINGRYCNPFVQSQFSTLFLLNLFTNLLNWHLNPDLPPEGKNIQSFPGLSTQSLQAPQLSTPMRNSSSIPENLLLFPCLQSQEDLTIQPVTRARNLGVALELGSSKFPISTQSPNPPWHFSVVSFPLCPMAHVQCRTPSVSWDTATSHGSSPCHPSVFLTPTPAGFYLPPTPRLLLASPPVPATMLRPSTPSARLPFPTGCIWHSGPLPVFRHLLHFIYRTLALPDFSPNPQAASSQTALPVHSHLDNF